jgi:hypothetical protein
VVEEAALRPLKKREIDRRIERIWSGILAGGAIVPVEDYEPVWISTADFVRRMKPFLVDN